MESRALAVTGTTQAWSRDLAIIGGATSLVAPAMAMPFDVSLSYVLAAAVTGAVSGAALGQAMPSMLERVRGRVPLPGLIAVGAPLLGAVWGGLVGAVAFAVSGDHMLWLSVMSAAIAGALQLGLVWFPYTFATVTNMRRWPVVLAACMGTPLVGFLTIVAVMSAIGG